MQANIPDKLTFKRQDVIKLTRLDGKVIDYWQKEFGGFQPTVNPTGETFYTRQDLEVILKIKYLLIEERVTKSKIREMIQSGQIKKSSALETGKPVPIHRPGFFPLDKLKIIKQSLQEILTILDKNDKF